MANDSKNHGKIDVRGKLRDALITGTAGATLGGLVLEGGRIRVPTLLRKLARLKRKTVGLHGGKAGFVVGAGLGLSKQRPSKESADAIAAGGDWNFSAFIEDMKVGALPKDVQADVRRFVDAKAGTPVVHYGMTVKELLGKADMENLKSARKTLGTLRASRARDEVLGKVKDGSKYILIMNDRIVDGHHFLAKAERGAVTSSLNVLDLTPARVARTEFGVGALLTAGRFNPDNGTRGVNSDAKKAQWKSLVGSLTPEEAAMLEKNYQKNEAAGKTIRDGYGVVASGLVGQKLVREGRDRITGRTTLYHGTDKESARLIRRKGLKSVARAGTEGVTAQLMGKETDYARRVRKGAYLSHEKGTMGARQYASQQAFLKEGGKVTDEAGRTMAALTHRHKGEVLKYRVPLWRKGVQRNLMPNPEAEGLNGLLMSPANRHMLTERTKVMKNKVPEAYRVGSKHYKGMSMKEWKQYLKLHPGRAAAGAGLAAGGAALLAGGGIYAKKAWQERKARNEKQMAARLRLTQFAEGERQPTRTQSALLGAGGTLAAGGLVLGTRGGRNALRGLLGKFDKNDPRRLRLAGLLQKRKDASLKRAADKAVAQARDSFRAEALPKPPQDPGLVDAVKKVGKRARKRVVNAVANIGANPTEVQMQRRGRLVQFAKLKDDNAKEKQPDSLNVIKARQGGMSSGAMIGAGLASMIGTEQGGMASAAHAGEETVKSFVKERNQDLVDKIDRAHQRGQAIDLTPGEIKTYERLKSGAVEEGKVRALPPGRQTPMLKAGAESAEHKAAAPVKRAAVKAKWAVEDAGRGLKKWAMRNSMGRNLIAGGLVGGAIGRHLGGKVGRQMDVAQRRNQEKSAETRILRKATEVAKIKAIAEALRRDPNSFATRFDEKKKSTWKRKAAIAGGAVAGAAVGARTLPRLIRRGRVLKDGEQLTGKVLYTHEGLTTPLSVVNIGGKTLRRRLEKRAAHGSKLAGAAMKLDDFMGVPQRHYGVGAGGGRVIEKTKAHGHRMVDKEKFARGNRVHVDSDTLPKDEAKWGTWAKGMEQRNTTAAERASRGDLCLIRNNCEHHAREIAGQGRKSYQTRALAGGAVGGAVAGGAAVAAATRKQEKKFARLGGRLIAFETPVEKRNRVREMRDKIGLAKDVAGLGVIGGVGYGAHKLYQEGQKAVPYVKGAARAWHRAAGKAGKAADTIVDVGGPLAAPKRTGKWLGKMARVLGRKVGIIQAHDPRRPVQFARGERLVKIGRRELMNQGYMLPKVDVPVRRGVGQKKAAAWLKSLRQKPATKFAAAAPAPKRDRLQQVRDVALTGAALGGLAGGGYLIQQGRKLSRMKTAPMARQVQRTAQNVQNATSITADIGRGYNYLKEPIARPKRVIAGVRRGWRQGLKEGQTGPTKGWAKTLVRAGKALKILQARGRVTVFGATGALIGTLAGTLAGSAAGSRYKGAAQGWVKRKLAPHLSRKWTLRLAKAAAYAPENIGGMVGGTAGSFLTGGMRQPKEPQQRFARIGGRLIQFGGNEQLVDIDHGNFLRPMDMVVGRKKGYARSEVKRYNSLKKYLADVKSGIKKGHPQTVAQAKADMDAIRGKPENVGVGQVLRSAYREGEKVQRWAGRGGSLVKDARAHLRGEARERDASGRVKKREWEKGWFDRAKGSALAGGGLLAGALVLRGHPRLRAKMDRASRRMVRAVNHPVKGVHLNLVPQIGKQWKGKEVKNFQPWTPQGKRGAMTQPWNGGGVTAKTAPKGAYVSPKKAAAKVAQTQQVSQQAAQNIQQQAAAVTGKPAPAAATPAQPAATPKIVPFPSQGAATPKKKAAAAAKPAKAAPPPVVTAPKPEAPNSTGSLWSQSKILNEPAAQTAPKPAAKKPKAKKAAPAKPAPEYDGITGKWKMAREKKFAVLGGRLIEFDDPFSAGWDLRDARGRSARVFAPDAGQRDRRPKRWHEKVENERKLWAGASAIGTLGGAAAMHKLIGKSASTAVQTALKTERGKIRAALQKARALRKARASTPPPGTIPFPQSRSA